MTEQIEHVTQVLAMRRPQRTGRAPLRSPAEQGHVCPLVYVWLDATFHKVREAGRVVSVATVVAIGVMQTGERTVLGAATGPSEDHQFWTSFLRSLVKRGLKGVRLVISDAHEGLRQAIAKVLHEATWQRSSANMGAGERVPLVISAGGMRTLAA